MERGRYHGAAIILRDRSRIAQPRSVRHEISRDLIKPEEVLADMRADEMIVFTRGCYPLRCGRAIWWRRPEIACRVENSRFEVAV